MAAARSDVEFERHIASGELLLVYALVGSEGTLVSEAVALLRGKVLTRAPDFNRDELRVPEAAIERVVEAAGTMPMMAPRRFVHMAGLHDLKAKDHPTLLAYLEKPSPTTVLVLSGEKVDQRTKLGQKLASLGGLFHFDAPKPQELAGWIGRRAKKRGIAIDYDAVQLLADLLGVELGNVDRALDKLSLHAGPEATVTADDVEAVVAPTRVHSIFELTDAIGQRDLGRASSLLRNALQGGESGLPILAMIVRQFRQLLMVKELRQNGASQKDIAQATGIRPFLIDAFIAQAARYDVHELYLALQASARADLRLKSSRLGPGVLLDRLLVDVVGASRTR